MADHAKVEQRNLAVFSEINISGMRVGVKETVHEHLLQIGLEQFVGEAAAIECRSRKRRQLGDGLSCDVLHREHGASAEVGHRQRDANARELLQILGNHAEGGRLTLVIQFMQQRALKLFQHFVELIPSCQLCVALKEFDNFFN